MPVEWSDRASLDIEDLWNYIASDNPHAAARQVYLIEKAATKLERFPRIGRPGRCAGTREWVVSRTPYIVAYRIKKTEVEILRIIHARRQWPDSL